MKLKRWKKIKTEETYQCGTFYRVDKDKVLTPGKKETDYYVIRRPRDSVLIVPVDEEGMVHMTNQHRYPIDGFSLEFPAGGIDINETSLQAAKRELKEEMNLLSDKWKKIGRINFGAGLCDLKFIVYLAQGVYEVAGKSQDPIDENLHQAKIYPFDEVEQKIKNGEINAAPTISSFALYRFKCKL